MYYTSNGYIAVQNTKNAIEAKRKQLLKVLSLFVVLTVFWVLKLTGITMAGEAFCGFEEHTHSTECGQYLLICETAEQDPHTHTESCIAPQLICTVEESEGHSHNDDCFEKTVICTLDETPAHTHSESCKGPVYICNKEETEGHTHNENCTQKIMVCTEQETEIHSHNDDCYENTVICTLAETEAHIHSEECVEEQYICNLIETEGHTHGEECYSSNLICTDEESDGHIHGEECYTAGIGFGCGLLEADGHIHTEECVTAETQIGCGIEYTEGHTHTNECYQLTGECTVEEHTHTTSCYSNINADLETSADWESTIGGVVAGAKPAENIVAVAKSQLGYTESELNFEMDENGNRKGISRYGQWYGNPYGDWNTMFVSFCLHYSQLEGFPLSSGAETMRIEWESIEIYIPKEEIQPAAGDLLFLDKNSNGTADAVAVVTDFTDGQITVIEGDYENSVAQVVYSADDPAIMGYGVIPDLSGIMTLDERAVSAFAQTVTYSTSIFNSGSNFVIYTQSGSNYYAVDGNGNAVQIYIDSGGNITSNVADTDTLLWTVTSNQNGYYVQNISTGRYLYPYRSNSSNHGAINTNRNRATFSSASGGVRIAGGNNRYAYLSGSSFTDTSGSGNASIFYFGKTPDSYYVWLDGTNGGLISVTGSQDTRYTFYEGDTFNLPEEWPSPEKYQYKVRGWYDVTNSRYYLPGDEVSVTGNMVFYVDWVPYTYDIGIYDKNTVNTVSSDKIITTRLFDFNALFNVMSSNANVTVSANDHSETWTQVQSGKVNFNNRDTINFVFVDQDGSGTLHTPNSRHGNNNYQNAVTEGIFSDELAEILFSPDNCYDPQTGEGMVGKTYLGTGDYLFQYGTDPNSEYYGYYYYDSKLNAASYNMSEQRFYVYDYLEATTDTVGSSTGLHSDFLPLNSIYANTNGKNVPTYTYEGVNGEYEGTEHYRFDSRYNTSNSSADNVITNYSFGISMDVKFYLPGVPGSRDEDGQYKNVDVYDKEMIFRFSGDDDVWVLVDGELVMDIGGIHQIEAGEINFATGVVTVDGKQQRTLETIEAGEHVLTVYYLDRGGSMSNCAMYYSVAPRYSLNIRKEDVLTQQLLNGVKFGVYTDEECTTPAELWKSEESYQSNEPSQNEFTVTNGTVDIWGFVAGGTYYFKEISPPLEEDYERAKGIIRFAIDKKGIATYDIEMLPETDEYGNTIPISNGYTVHGVSIDEENHKAYIVVTNAQEWVKETTTVQVVKIWDDSKDHSSDYVTAYLAVTDPDGTVRRIREVILSDENEWTYIWTGLPKYQEDGITPVKYNIHEAYEEGYYSSTMSIGEIEINKSEWEESIELVSGKEYLFRTSSGYLSTTSSTSATFKWVNEETAKNSPLAKWTILINSSNQIRLTNGAGQIITYYSSWSNRRFNASTTSGSNQTFTLENVDSGGVKGIRLRSGSYYMGAINSSNYMSATNSSSSGLVFTPYTLVTQNDVIDIKDLGFKITNTPLEQETSLTVKKVWDDNDSSVDYQKELVTVKLLANGVDTGRTVTLMLKNDWQETFRGLPYKDEAGNVIAYTVEEIWSKNGWISSYGDVVSSGGDKPSYSITITNIYIPMGPELPSTGSFARLAYIYCGGGIMLASLIIGIRQRRRNERRSE